MARIKDLGTVSTTVTADRVDADLFKVSTTSSTLAVTFSGFDDGDEFSIAIHNTSGGFLTISITNTHLWQYGSGGLGATDGTTWHLTFRYFDGTYIETNRNS